MSEDSTAVTVTGTGTGGDVCNASPHAIFSECPLCGGGMRPEHAHYRCTECGWRDSCCD